MSNTSRRKRSPGSAAVSPLDTHLGYWLRVVSNHVSHTFKGRVEQHGVTVAEWVVMRALLDDDGTRPSELATTLGLTRGAVSKLLDRLASKGLVVVKGDRSDGRVQVVSLSPSGRRLVPQLAALADENDAEAFAHLDRKQRAMLFSLLQTLVQRLGLREAAVR